MCQFPLNLGGDVRYAAVAQMGRVTGCAPTSAVGGELAFTCFGLASWSRLPASPFIWNKKVQVSLDVISHTAKQVGNRESQGEWLAAIFNAGYSLKSPGELRKLALGMSNMNQGLGNGTLSAWNRLSQRWDKSFLFIYYYFSVLIFFGERN